MESDAATTLDAAPIPLAPRGAWALVIHGPRREVVELPRGLEVSIGRSRSSGITVRDAAVSRLHATLRHGDGAELTVRDHESRHGVFVAGARVRGEARLRSGDAITVGPARIIVFAPTPVDRDPDAQERVAIDPAMAEVVTFVDRAAATALPVLLLGETGVGKEVLARRLHARSARASAPFVAANCGAITEGLAESILFGHERGAFTGADRRHAGLFEQASSGTLFLDEVGELGAATQVRLLRVLEEQTILRVGGTLEVPVDVRVVAATHRDLSALVSAGRFRADLLYRIDVLRVLVPPLRDRPDDIPWLAARFLQELAPGTTMSQAALTRLRAYPWPGNVRELRNTIARAVALSEGSEIREEDLALEEIEARGSSLDLRRDDAERSAIRSALEACGGNQSQAAARLGLSRRALIYRMERLGLKTLPASRR